MPRLRCRFRPLLSGLALVLAGCQMGPDFTPPEAAAPSAWSDLPATSLAAGSGEALTTAGIDPAWWTVFGDPILTDLEERVARDNPTIAAAEERLAQSRAVLRTVAADRLPSVGASGSYQRERISSHGVLAALAGPDGTNQSSSDDWQYGFDASWELDLWGRVRRETEAADADVDAAAEDRRDTRLVIMAEVARDYIDLRRLQAALALNRDSLATAEGILALARDRAHGGTATDLDVVQASAERESILAEGHRLRQQREQTLDALAFLLGERPGNLPAGILEDSAIPPVPPQVPAGLPSDLARRRPDIRRAEAQLHAATAEIGVATADFYPRVTLSGNAGFEARQLSGLGDWSSRSFGIGPGFSVPIFEGGRLKGTLALREHQQRAAALTYRATVLNAWREVDDSLAAYLAEQGRRQQLERAVEEDRQALDLARARYAGGIADFLPVLDAERTLVSARRDAVDSQGTMATNLVSLYKALGGGWPEPSPSSESASADPSPSPSP